MPDTTASQDTKVSIHENAEVKAAAVGNENQIANDIEKVGGNFVQAHESDVQIGHSFSGDRNVNVLGDLTIYLASRPAEPEPEQLSAEIGPNPYKGLSAFQETDAERFFGRERVTQVLYDKFCALHEPPLDGPTPLRLLAILGPSGSGKSSVARAGLLPQLAMQPLPGTQQARVAVFTPGIRPLEALATILARIATGDPTPLAKKQEFTAALQDHSDGPCEGLRHIADILPDIDSQPLILLIDQFEEVYAKEVTSEERRLFLDNLLCAAADPSGHLSVILTLRSDFLGQTQSYPELNKAIAEQGEIIPVMDEAELRQAIAKPAENAGHALDDTCVDLLIEQSKGHEGVLPLLQFALTRIWDGLAAGVSPADTLKQIGGVGGALAGEAQRLYETLPETDKAIARRAFLALVQLGEGTRDTRRRISLGEVVAHGEESEHVQAVIRSFADPRARLVTLSATTEGAETAEVTHEALLDHWDTLKEWLDDNREDLRFHRHLAADADYWETQGKPDGKLWHQPDLDLLRQYHQRAGQDMTPLQVEFFEASVQKERHSKRIRRMAVTALTVLTIVALGAAALAWWAYTEANTQKKTAIQQSRLSQVRSVVAYSYKEDAQNHRERAALLARQADMLNRRFGGNLDTEIDDALRTIFRTAEIVEGPGHNLKKEELLKFVCQNVRHKKNLSVEEWHEFVGDGIEHELACPNVFDEPHIILRSASMTTMTDMEALSLNLRQDGSYGYPIDYIENDFEDQGEVIFDRATGLMWQQSGSDEEKIHKEAKSYCETLELAGHSDWRLPTVEELLSLLEQERQSNDLYLDSLFDGEQWWVWSSDLRQIKDEGSAGSAWGVYFHYGNVTLLGIQNLSYVRCVRS